MHVDLDEIVGLEISAHGRVKFNLAVFGCSSNVPAVIVCGQFQIGGAGDSRGRSEIYRLKPCQAQHPGRRIIVGNDKTAQPVDMYGNHGAQGNHKQDRNAKPAKRRAKDQKRSPPPEGCRE